MKSLLLILTLTLGNSLFATPASQDTMNAYAAISAALEGYQSVGISSEGPCEVKFQLRPGYFGAFKDGQNVNNSKENVVCMAVEFLDNSISHCWVSIAGQGHGVLTVSGGHMDGTATFHLIPRSKQTLAVLAQWQDGEGSPDWSRRCTLRAK